jgi:predicted RNase H-like HicB family nuclease
VAQGRCFGAFGKTSLATRSVDWYGDGMKAEFTAIIEAAPEGGYWAICPEVPGANGQGKTVEETKRNLVAAIQLIFEDRRADILRGLPEDAIQEKILVG